MLFNKDTWYAAGAGGGKTTLLWDKYKELKQQMEPKESYFDKAIKQIVEMHHKKASDYTDSGEFNNFIESAQASGIETYQAIENLIGTKEARIRTIRRKMKEGKDVNNEPLLDSYLDRAVYALIQYAYQLKREDEKNAVKPYFTGEAIVANPFEQDKITYTQGLDPSDPSFGRLTQSTHPGSPRISTNEF